MKRNIVNILVFILIVNGCTAKQKEASINMEVLKPNLTAAKKAIIKQYTDSLSHLIMHGTGSRTGANAFQVEKTIMYNIFKLDSVDYTASYLMAQVYAKGKNYDSAIYYLTRVINFNPNLLRYYDFRGALWLIKSEKVKADADYTKMLSILEVRMKSTSTPNAMRVANIAQMAITHVMLGKFDTQHSLDYYNDNVKKLHLSPDMDKATRGNRAGVVSFNKNTQIEAYARGYL